MNYGSDILFGKDIFKSCSVSYIRLVETGLLAGDSLYPSEYLFACIGEIVQYNNFSSAVLKFNHSVASDKTGTAGNKYLTHKTSFNKIIYDPYPTVFPGGRVNKLFLKALHRSFQEVPVRSQQNRHRSCS